MPLLDIQSVELVSTLRAAAQNGAPSSSDYNDYDILTSVSRFQDGQPHTVNATSS